MLKKMEKFNQNISCVLGDSEFKLSEDMTAKKVNEILTKLTALRDALDNAVEAVEEIASYLVSPWSGSEKQEVSTIGQYMMQGFDATKAPLVREHDILWNRREDEVITIAEADRLEKILEMDIF